MNTGKSESEIIIWHNNICSSSRKILDLLQQHSKNIEIRDYINNPPTIAELRSVLKMMGQKPEYILRKKDKVFQEFFADKKLDSNEWLKAMKQNPSIIERPIVIMSGKAFLARPYEEFAAGFKEMF